MRPRLALATALALALLAAAPAAAGARRPCSRRGAALQCGTLGSKSAGAETADAPCKMRACDCPGRERSDGVAGGATARSHARTTFACLPPAPAEKCGSRANGRRCTDPNACCNKHVRGAAAGDSLPPAIQPWSSAADHLAALCCHRSSCRAGVAPTRGSAARSGASAARARAPPRCPPQPPSPCPRPLAPSRRCPGQSPAPAPSPRQPPSQSRCQRACSGEPVQRWVRRPSPRASPATM